MIRKAGASILFGDLLAGKQAAEYTVDGALFNSRNCRLPDSTAQYQTGDEIIIRYSEKKPYISKIADDTKLFKSVTVALLVLISAVVLLFFFR